MKYFRNTLDYVMRLEFQLALSGHVPNLLTELQPISDETPEVLDVLEKVLHLRRRGGTSISRTEPYLSVKIIVNTTLPFLVADQHWLLHWKCEIKILE